MTGAIYRSKYVMLETSIEAVRRRRMHLQGTLGSRMKFKMVAYCSVSE
jgi:hypothetical protein